MNAMEDEMENLLKMHYLTRLRRHSLVLIVYFAVYERC